MGASQLKVGLMHIPPYYIIEDGSPPRGILTLVLQNTLSELQIPFEMSSYPAKRLYYGISKGKVQLTIAVKDAQAYKDNALYSELPVYSLEMRVYALKNTTMPDNLQGLMGKSLGLIRGLDYLGWADKFSSQQNRPNISILNHHKNAFAMLRAGRIQFLLDYEDVLERQEGIDFRSEISSKEVKKVDLFYVVSKNMVDSDKLIKKLNQFLSDNRVKSEN